MHLHPNPAPLFEGNEAPLSQTPSSLKACPMLLSASSWWRTRASPEQSLLAVAHRSAKGELCFPLAFPHGLK